MTAVPRVVGVRRGPVVLAPPHYSPFFLFLLRRIVRANVCVRTTRTYKERKKRERERERERDARAHQKDTELELTDCGLTD